MRSIKPSTLNPKDLMLSIGKKLKKDKDKFQNLKDKLNTAFDVYDDNLQTLEKIIPLDLDNDEKFFLLSLYNRERTDIKGLWENLKKANDGIEFKCPICGIDSIYQLDHYIPKESYPEYSVHCHNLIPLCGKCNNKKSKLWLDDTKKYRLIFNAYYDSPKKEILDIKILVVNDIPTIKLGYLLSKDKWTIEERTIDLLELLPRINDELTQELNNETNRIINGFDISIFATKDKYITYQLSQYKIFEENKKLPEIQALLYKGIICSNEYFEWLKNQLTE